MPTDSAKLLPGQHVQINPQGVELSNLGSFMIRLDEDTKAAIYKTQAKVGNPAVVGLAGFGLTTLVLQFHNVGWMGVGPVVWLGLLFGGMAQLIAGLQEYGTGNNFGYSAFTTYGAFWMSLAFMLIGDHFGIYKTTKADVGCFLLAFTFYTFIMWIGTFSLNVALWVVFGLLLLGFILLDVAHFVGTKALQGGFTKAGGVVLIFCALGAWYVMAHLIYKDVYKRDILPVGRAPCAIIQEKLGRKRYQPQQPLV